MKPESHTNDSARQVQAQAAQTARQEEQTAAQWKAEEHLRSRRPATGIAHLFLQLTNRIENTVWTCRGHNKISIPGGKKAMKDTQLLGYEAKARGR